MNSFPFSLMSFPLPTFPWEWLIFGNDKLGLKPLKNLSFMVIKVVPVPKTHFRKKRPSNPHKIRGFPVPNFLYVIYILVWKWKFHTNIFFTFFGKEV